MNILKLLHKNPNIIYSTSGLLDHSYGDVVKYLEQHQAYFIVSPYWHMSDYMIDKYIKLFNM